MKVAIVDLGTNTCRLFLATVAGASEVRAHVRQTTVVRLGEGVDEDRRLRPAAIERTRACLAGYAAELRRFSPERRLLIATSVLRDARDGAAFLAAVEREYGMPSRVLRGEEEAALAFRGGTAELAATSASGKLVLIDIGGGSTEFAIGAPGGAPSFVRSLDVGAVRLTERFIRHDPPLPGELTALSDFVAGTIAGNVPAAVRNGVAAAVGVAGTYTTLVAHKLALTVYQPELVHGHVLTLADIEASLARFVGLTHAQRARLAGIQAGREDVIIAGAVIAREACRAFSLDAVRCSEADLLEGAALALAEGSLAASTAD
ncbi:MAG: Ppx/GppA family phosphatase [Thermoleophilia bacterium]|mgnify:FL=1